MTDEDFLAAFEAGGIPAPDHAAHVRAAYVLLRHCSFPQALARLEAALKRIAGAAGRADRYHETVTVANLALIQRHLDERGAGGGWEDFARLNPELFDRGLLRHYYPAAVLECAQARRIFLLPSGRPSPEP